MATTGTADSSGNEAAHVKPFPMNRLPDELLIHIFSNLAPESLVWCSCAHGYGETDCLQSIGFLPNAMSNYRRDHF